jgi:hypothetical protein
MASAPSGDGRHPEVDLPGGTGQPQGVGALIAQALESTVDALDLAQPALGQGAFPPLLQGGLQFVQAGQRLRVNVQLRTPQASVLMLATRPIRAPAGAELDLAFVEVSLHLSNLILERVLELVDVDRVEVEAVRLGFL